jgi:hypothetical protein
LDVERLSISAKINRDLHRWHNNPSILASENDWEKRRFRKSVSKEAFQGKAF